MRIKLDYPGLSHIKFDIDTDFYLDFCGGNAGPEGLRVPTSLLHIALSAVGIPKGIPHIVEDFIVEAAKRNRSWTTETWTLGS